MVKLLGVSNVTVYKKLKQFETQLEGKVYKENNITFLKPEAIEVIKNSLAANILNDSKANNIEASSSLKQFEVRLETTLEKHLEKIEKQMELKNSEMKRKDEMINQLIKNQAQERERTDTIIMKLTQDVNLLQHETKRLLENDRTPLDKQKQPEECQVEECGEVTVLSQNKPGKIIPIKNAAKFAENIENKQVDHSEVKSFLKRLYIRLFKPELLRKAN